MENKKYNNGSWEAAAAAGPAAGPEAQLALFSTESREDVKPRRSITSTACFCHLSGTKLGGDLLFRNVPQSIRQQLQQLDRHQHQQQQRIPAAAAATAALKHQRCKMLPHQHAGVGGRGAALNGMLHCIRMAIHCQAPYGEYCTGLAWPGRDSPSPPPYLWPWAQQAQQALKMALCAL